MISRQTFTLVLVSLGALLSLGIYLSWLVRSAEKPVDEAASCPGTQCAYVPSTLECVPNSRTRPDRSICMSSTVCDLRDFPCVGAPGKATLCPGQDGFRPDKGTDGFCTDVAVCPNWATLHFTRTGMGEGVYGQTRGLVLGYFTQLADKACGLNDAAKEAVVPKACMQGGWLRVDDLWYCANHDLPCDAVLMSDNTIRCI